MECKDAGEISAPMPSCAASYGAYCAKSVFLWGVGVRLEWQQPRTTRIPACAAAPANTSMTPEHCSKVNAWGAWLCCSNPDCGLTGCGDASSCPNYRTGSSSFHQASVCETRLLYGDADDAMVPLLASWGHLITFRKDLLLWSVSV